MKYLVLILKGFIIGLAKIIPGVSGAVLSISLGVYETLINIIGHPLKIKFDDLKFLFCLLFGASLGIILLCDCVKWGLNSFYLPTILLFVGLIVGGLPDIVKEINTEDFKTSNYIIFVISFIFILIVTNLSKVSETSNNYFFLMGMVESLTTIIPGISGTAIFMALGWYESLLDLLKNILTFKAPLFTCFLFISGFIMSTILISKLLNFVFKRYKSEAYFCILGFMGGSLWTMFNDIFKHNFSNISIFLGIILFSLGIFSTIKINNFFSKF